MSIYDLPSDRLSTTDQKGNRIYLYPADVRGYFRSLRSKLNAGLILLFLTLPWIRIGGSQAILLDIPHRRFAILGLTFWAHDTPLLLFVFGGAAILLAFVTAIWGRVWCGWTCPQTVFVDGVFRKVERWIEGDSVERRRRDREPLSFESFSKKTIKWILFTGLSLIVSHSFLAYFVGTEKLSEMMGRSPVENTGSFLFMAFFTGAILFDFGWFREQFCTLVCPYGRFQSILMDDQSTVVLYDVARGEPRRGSGPQGSSDIAQGDCVNCYRCVQVCPTGIDIRRGTQMECIACTSCIDACDDVMTRIKKPVGLIRYGSTSAVANQNLGKDPKSIRLRIWINGALLFAAIVGLITTLSGRSLLSMTLTRAVDIPYQELKSASGMPEIINHFKMDLRNQSFEDQKITFRFSTELQAQGIELVVSNHPASLIAGESERSDLFVRFPKTILTSGHATVSLEIQSKSETQGKIESFKQEVRLVGPFL